MKCCDAEKYIMKYMDSEITKKEAEELNQHIQQCQKCKESFLFYDNMLQVFEQMSLYEAPEDFESNVMMQIQALEKIEQRSYVNNRILGHIWSVFTVLFGTGAILVFYKQPIIQALEKNDILKQWVKNIMPIEQNISQQGQVLEDITENVILWIDKVLVNGFGVLLLLLCIVCAVQYVILKRKKQTDRIQHK
ncbi:hypothetical protein [Clostridium sp. MD294]|uniref:anti-sigma factor family protein n=1 Tax=Clostridium sp. MD294 TaxID=97138 RepID=UPI0002C9C911|nr:hypothetical protein [Clostridium sp. MD294]NDO46734.1 hypothetical protein [Clostridium sp. MD294]USF28825.1 hypothetical protein C820_000199 [Clostridium sp. MD294]